MPIYEYKCLDCGVQIERMRKVSDAPLTVCDNCGGKLEKQWSLSGFQFKGAGWYVTDYAGKSKEGKGGKSDNSEKADKTDKADKTEKNSTGESTAKSETASNKTNDSAAADSKKEASAKKD